MPYSRLQCLIKLRNLLKKNADDASILAANLSLKIIDRKDQLQTKTNFNREINRLNYEIDLLSSKRTRRSPYTIGDDNLVSLARNAQFVANQAKEAARRSGTLS